MGGRLAARGFLLILPDREYASDIPLAVVNSAIKTSLHMRSHQASFIAKFTAIIAVLAWFVASNHCALSALAEHVAKSTAPAAECKHCPSKDSKDGNSGGISACCKGIRATTSTPGIAGFDAACCGKLLCVLEMLTPPALEALPVSIAGTGPPRSVSFAEAVLSHSLQSHAPPVLV